MAQVIQDGQGQLPGLLGSRQFAGVVCHRGWRGLPLSARRSPCSRAMLSALVASGGIGKIAELPVQGEMFARPRLVRQAAEGLPVRLHGHCLPAVSHSRRVIFSRTNASQHVHSGLARICGSNQLSDDPEQP